MPRISEKFNADCIRKRVCEAAPTFATDCRLSGGLRLSLAFSQDGQHLAPASRDSALHAWDVVTGVFIPGLRRHTRQSHILVVSGIHSCSHREHCCCCRWLSSGLRRGGSHCMYLECYKLRLREDISLRTGFYFPSYSNWNHLRFLILPSWPPS